MAAQTLSKEEQEIAREAGPRAAELRSVVEAHAAVARQLRVLYALLIASNAEPISSYARDIVADSYERLTGTPLRPEPDI